VNDQEEVVGYSRSNDVPPHAFLFTNGVMNDLGTFGGGYSVATGINDAGAVVGYTQRADGNQRAFLYLQGNMSDLGTLGGAQSFANAINNQGQIVGYAETSIVNHAFLFQDGVMTDLDTLGTNYSIANAINVNGQAVGIARFPGLGLHAAIFQNGAMIDINTLLPASSGWELTEARGINDSGQIVGYGTFAGQYPRAFLLSPIPPPKVTCSVDQPLLWPPNQSLVNVGLGVTVNPPDASLTVLVYANDDASPSDAANIGPGTLQLRSERQAEGNGRIYLIIATATNLAGTSFDLCPVVVPHDNSPTARSGVQQQAAAAVAYYREFQTPPPGFTPLQ
jgi:probable HAF family extracellular repeat protein